MQKVVGRVLLTTQAPPRAAQLIILNHMLFAAAQFYLSELAYSKFFFSLQRISCRLVGFSLTSGRRLLLADGGVRQQQAIEKSSNQVS